MEELLVAAEKKVTFNVPENQNPLKPILLREYATRANGFIALSQDVFRSKENRYPFIVLTKEDGQQETIFFTKRLSEEFETQDVINIRELKDCFVITVEYDDGRETRHKLSRMANMVSVDDFNWE